MHSQSKEFLFFFEERGKEENIGKMNFPLKKKKKKKIFGEGKYFMQRRRQTEKEFGEGKYFFLQRRRKTEKEGEENIWIRKVLFCFRKIF